MNELMDRGDCRTAPATPGLLNIALRLRELLKAKELHLTVHPELSPETDIIKF